MSWYEENGYRVFLQWYTFKTESMQIGVARRMWPETIPWWEVTAVYAECIACGTTDWHEAASCDSNAWYYAVSCCACGAEWSTEQYELCSDDDWELRTRSFFARRDDGPDVLVEDAEWLEWAR